MNNLIDSSANLLEVLLTEPAVVDKITTYGFYKIKKKKKFHVTVTNLISIAQVIYEFTFIFTNLGYCEYENSVSYEF